jgi:O-methyltransferase
MKIPYFSRKREAIDQERYRNINNYLTLMERCLTGMIYEDAPLNVLGQTTYNAELREYGWDWPSTAHTMIGAKRLHNVRFLLEQCLSKKVPGDFVETGVWRGGACILAKAVLSAHGNRDRKIWLADSFEGLPPPKPDLYPADTGDEFHTYKELAVDIETVRNNFRKYDLLDENVQFLKGWFSDTLANAPIASIAVLRLDGDMYESTLDALNALYSKVSNLGYIIVDDYHVVPGCKSAIHDYLNKHSISVKLQEIDGVGVFWQKQMASL